MRTLKKSYHKAFFTLIKAYKRYYLGAQLLKIPFYKLISKQTKLAKWQEKRTQRREFLREALNGFKSAKHLYKTFHKESEKWLNSQEFKQKYLDTKHPFPPLLNPALLNDENSSLNYNNISAELAWEWNLPLPKNYDLIYFNNGATASVAILNFFELCEIMVCPYWFIGYEKYKQDYEILVKNQHSFNAIAVYMGIGDKYFHLLSKKVPIFYITRDPISKIKSACNHWLGTATEITPLMKRFTLANKDYKSLFPQDKYWGGGLPSINVGFGIETLFYKICFDSFLEAKPNLDKFYIFTFDEFSPNRAYETFQKIAKIFGLNMPQDERLFNVRAEKARFGMVVLPVCLYAHKQDINKKHFDKTTLSLKDGVSVYVGGEPSVRNDANFIELTEQILGEKCFINDSEIIIYTAKNEVENLLKDNELLGAVKEYLQGYVRALKANVDETLKHLINERQILDFLRNDKEKRKMLKDMCDKELRWLKANRPDIVESWQYYNEFEKMCAELDFT